MLELDISRLPTASGVYLMRDFGGSVLYVGKAKNLRARLRSYLRAEGDGRPQIRLLLERVSGVETIVTDTENEALILENTLIKRYRPRYNINLRDDKTYVSLRLDPREEFPALQVVRRVPRDGALYFGPFTSPGAVRETLKEIYRIFPLRHYPMEACRRRRRPCLFHQIGQCCAPCHGLVGRDTYAEMVRGVIALLSGREGEVLDLLRQRMQAAAVALRFEEAGRLRDQIRAIEQTVEKQKVVEPGGGDQDVFGLHRAGGEVEVAVLFIRQGRLVGRRTLALEWSLDEPELLAGLLQQFYDGEVFIPDQVIVPLLPEGADTVMAWLGGRKGRRVSLVHPRRGDRLRLLQMAERNAEESFRERGSRTEARQGLLRELQERLHLSRLPRRIECFDISNVQGRHAVGSMVVFVDGEPDKNEYRRFRVRTVVGADDYASQHEVLQRRLQRGKDEGVLPDLILIDGGKGQLAVLTSALEALQLHENIDAAALAKSRVVANVRARAVERSIERVFRPGRKNPVDLRPGSPALFLLIRLRDEAHRFAIEYHRRLRQKATLLSELEQVPGIGPGRRRLLLRHFGSVRRIAAASIEDLCAVPGVSPELAQRVHAFLLGSDGGKKTPPFAI